MITVYICLLKEIAKHINELAIISLHLNATTKQKHKHIIKVSQTTKRKIITV